MMQCVSNVNFHVGTQKCSMQNVQSEVTTTLKYFSFFFYCMNTDITSHGVPFFLNYDQVLMPNNLADWKKVPWAHCSLDQRLEKEKKKYTDLDELRFCEGWLFDRLRCPHCGFTSSTSEKCSNCGEGWPTFGEEWYWAKTFKSWANWMKHKDYLRLTNYCENCSGSFWEITFPGEIPYLGFMPGYWVHNGKWVYYDGKHFNFKSSAPPSFCVGSAATQFRYNRRITIQYHVWDEVQKLTELQIHQLEKRIKEKEKRES